MGIGLDQADKVASVVGAVAGVVGLIITVRFARGRPASRTARSQGGGGPDGFEVVGGVLGVLFGIAVLVGCGWAAVAGFGLLFDDDEPDGPGTSTAAGTTASPRPSASAAAGPAKPPGPTTPPGAPVLWRGEVLLDGTPRDFDHEPPRRGDTGIGTSSDGYVEGSTYMKWFGSVVVLWPGPGDPDRDDCAARLETRGIERVPIDARSRICLRTNEGRVVYLKVLGREGDGYNAMATLWSTG